MLHLYLLLMGREKASWYQFHIDLNVEAYPYFKSVFI